MCHRADVQVTTTKGSDFLSRYPGGRVELEVSCRECGASVQIYLDPPNDPEIIGLVDGYHLTLFCEAVGLREQLSVQPKQSTG